LKYLKNKTSSFLIAIVLPFDQLRNTNTNVNAHTPTWQIPTYAYVQSVPNPVGVGQSALIYMWVDKIPDGAQLGNSIRFQNYELKITAPDGTVQTQTFPTIQDPTSNQHFSFTPTQIGTYILNFTFPGYTYTYTGLIPGFFGPPAPSAYVGDTYLPALHQQHDRTGNSNTTIPTVPLPESY
jgi:hypothetical protein